jgi:hypothetical protein
MPDQDTSAASANDVFLNTPKVTGFRVCKTQSGARIGIEFFQEGGNSVVVLPRHAVGDLLAGLVVAIDGTVEGRGPSASATCRVSPPMAPS